MNSPILIADESLSTDCALIRAVMHTGHLCVLSPGPWLLSNLEDLDRKLTMALKCFEEDQPRIKYEPPIIRKQSTYERANKNRPFYSSLKNKSWK